MKLCKACKIKAPEISLTFCRLYDTVVWVMLFEPEKLHPKTFINLLLQHGLFKTV